MANARFAQGGIWECEVHYGYNNIRKNFGVEAFSTVVEQYIATSVAFLGLSLFAVIGAYTTLATMGNDCLDPTNSQLKR